MCLKIDEVLAKFFNWLSIPCAETIFAWSARRLIERHATHRYTVYGQIGGRNAAEKKEEVRKSFRSEFSCLRRASARVTLKVQQPLSLPLLYPHLVFECVPFCVSR